MTTAPADDVRAIEQLQRTFARLNDERRWHEAAGLFTEDGCLVRPSDPQRPIVGRAAILQSFLARPAGPARRHLVADPQVELIDRDHARACCHSIVLEAQGEHAGSVSLGGFEDRLVRTSEGWRFRSRTGFTTFGPVRYATHAADPLPGRGSACSAPQPQS